MGRGEDDPQPMVLEASELKPFMIVVNQLQELTLADRRRSAPIVDTNLIQHGMVLITLIFSAVS